MKKDKKKKKKKSSSSESSNESSSSGPEFQEIQEVKGMPGFVYEVDKLGNKIISRAPPDVKKKETRKSKAMGTYNQMLNNGPP